MRSIFPTMPIATSLKSNIDLTAASTCRLFCPDLFQQAPTAPIWRPIMQIAIDLPNDFVAFQAVPIQHIIQEL